MTRDECTLKAPCDELKEATKALIEVRLQLQTVVTEMRAINNINRRLDNHGDRIEELQKLSTQAAETSSSSHKRLDSMETGQRWLIGATISLVLGVAGLFISLF